MKYISLLTLVLLVLSGCSKMEEKKETTGNKTMPPMTKDGMNDPHSNMSGMQNKNDSQGNDEALKLSQEANEFEKAYEKTKDDKTKKQLVEKHLAAALALSPSTNPEHMNKETIRTSLKHFKRVLELDPENADAKAGREEIVQMYEMIGVPLPE